MLYHPKSENGQGLVEYALILLFIAIAIIAILLILGPTLGNTYSKIINIFPT
ncbi:MAG TPA: pilus assembly protein [Chloroflexi bacterium]|nr:pilus assembly protein [Chloroflexota bacterium]